MNTQNRYWHGYPIEAVNVADLVPYENNPRINAAAVPAVVASIKAVGFINPIVVDADNVIINGHTRRLAAMKLGMEKVPCIRPTDLSPKQIKLLRLADNKTSELSDWDFDKMKDEWEQIKDEFDKTDFGFNLAPDEVESEQTDNIQPRQVEEKTDTTEKYQIIIMCKTEEECETLYNELQEKGIQCRVSTL